MSCESKLVELRRRTDRDLMILVRRELDRGLALADTAAATESTSFARAERAYQVVTTWLPVISGLSQEDRRILELRLQELRSAIDRLSSDTLQQNLVAVAD
jgi:hypothetical protein